MNDLRILVIEDRSDRADMILEGLRADGYGNITLVNEVQGLAAKLVAAEPDIVLIDIANPSRDMLTQLADASAANERPVAMFVDQSDESMAKAALDAGVSAYVVNGMSAERIRPVMETAIARFHAFSRLKSELAATKAALEERKTIDRAKGLLMKMRGVDEEAAYQLLRKTAMDQGRRVADVAQALVSSAELLR